VKRPNVRTALSLAADALGFGCIDLAAWWVDPRLGVLLLGAGLLVLGLVVEK